MLLYHLFGLFSGLWFATGMLVISGVEGGVPNLRESPYGLPMLGLSLVLGLVMSVWPNRWVNTKLPGRRREIHTRLVDQGLLQVVLEDANHERLPHLTSFNRFNLVPKKSVQGESLAYRLQGLLLTYEQCCYDLGIGGFPQVRQGRLVLLILIPLLVIFSVCSMFLLRSIVRQAVIIGAQPDLSGFFALIIVAVVGSCLGFLWSLPTLLNRWLTSIALPLELAEIIRQEQDVQRVPS